MKEGFIIGLGVAGAWLVGVAGAASASTRVARDIPPPVPSRPRRDTFPETPPITNRRNPDKATNVNNTVWSRAQLEEIVKGVALRSRVPLDLVRGLVQQESRWNPAASNYNTDGTTDAGLFQLNSRHAGKSEFPATLSDFYDPELSAPGAERLLREARSHWGTNWKMVAVEYHHGYTKSKRLDADGFDAETEDYLAKVLGNWKRYAAASGREFPYA